MAADTVIEPQGLADPALSLFERADLSAEMVRIESRLIAEFGARLSDDVVREQLQQCLTGFHDARLHHFIPVLVERRARRELAARQSGAKG